MGGEAEIGRACVVYVDDVVANVIKDKFFFIPQRVIDGEVFWCCAEDTVYFVNGENRLIVIRFQVIRDALLSFGLAVNISFRYLVGGAVDFNPLFDFILLVVCPRRAYFIDIAHLETSLE